MHLMEHLIFLLAPESVDEPEFDLEVKSDSEPEQEVVQELNLEQESEPEPEVFVSAAEHFIEADTDNDGALSIEELSQATGFQLMKQKNYIPKQIPIKMGKFLFQNSFLHQLQKRLLHSQASFSGPKTCQ